MGEKNDNLEFLLSQYLDGQLRPDEMERLEERLGRDLELRGELQKYAGLNEMLAGMKTAPELDKVDFDAQRHAIMARLERKALLVPRPRFNVIRLTFAGAAAIAAVAIITFSAVMFFHANTPPTPPTQVAVVSVTLLPPTPSAHAEVVVAMEGAAPLDPTQEIVMVQYNEVPDNEFRLDAKEPDFVEDSSAPAGTVLMVGAPPKAPAQSSDMNDLLLME